MSIKIYFRNSTGMLYWFPDEKLPSYNSAINVANAEDGGAEGGGGANKHWAAKFFDYSNDPPPTYAEATTSSATRRPGN